MTSSSINIGNTVVHYQKSGLGPAILLCFHGFGEHGSSFEHLAARLPHHMIIAIDLPFHGKTSWQNDEVFAVKELVDIIKACPEIQEKSYGLLGYSMGGRIALSLYETIPHKVEFLLLIAPDGLVVNPWYWFATKTGIGKKLFHYTMKNPGWFLGLLNFSKQLRLVNQSIFKFVQSQVGDADMREKIFRVWTGFKNFSPDLRNICVTILKYHTPVYFLFGKYDRIIRPDKGMAFVQEIKPYGKIKVIESGHQLLHPKNISAITDAIKVCYLGKTSGV